MTAPGGPDPETEGLRRSLAERFPRVALVHEWLTIPGGSEQVLVELLGLFPHAEIFTSIYDPAPWPQAISRATVHTSFLDRLPGARRHYPRLLPLMNSAFESFDLSGFDLVVSSSHACAKNVLTPPSTLHVSYCHTPPRYAWEPRFFRGEEIGRLQRVALPLLLRRLRADDLAGGFRPDHFVANSSEVAARIGKYYRRPSTVIHPPVDVGRFLRVERAPEDYYLSFGRLVPYKRVDLAIDACARLGRRLKIVGDGRAGDALRARAGAGVEFLGRVGDDELDALLAGARALLFPGEEDFGIVPVEARAAGVPVVAYAAGGVLDSVRDGESGVLFAEQSGAGLADAILRFEAREWDDAAVRHGVERFDRPRFRREILEFIDRVAR